MASPILLALCTIIGLYALKLYLQFARNLKAAKESGIPYTIVPFFLVNRLYQISSIILIPVMRKFPKSWTEPWYDLTLEWGWHRRYEPFKRFGSDTFITVSPERNVLFTADADVIVQMTTRRNDFPKPLEVYGSIQLFGDNVVTVEGQQWRHHRKITSPPFTEKNNHLVWVETLDQCQAMINSWLGGQSDTARTIRTIADDAMRLSLHVISRAGFGVRLQWPGTEKPQTKGSMKEDSEDPVSSSEFKGHHTMSYTEALSTVLHNIIAILVTPSFLLSELVILKF